MGKVAHVIGNGDSAVMYKPSKGFKITCNLPPFTVENVYTTCMVDFKMMAAIAEGSVTVPGEWVLGMRPKIWADARPDFFMKHAKQIKEFYTVLPKYKHPSGAEINYTDFNCGHMATHYTANRLKANEIHMYGFDSMFDFNLRSCSDLYLTSDRSPLNSNRLTNNWRAIWPQLFADFPDVQFVLHHKHDAIKFPVGDNVEIRTK